MMTTKLFEIRDRGTFISALAIQVSAADGWLMQRAGFGEVPMVYLIMLATAKCSYDPYSWTGGRTMPIAHHYIAEHWDDLVSGAVVDVEFIQGERPEPELSEAVLR